MLWEIFWQQIILGRRNGSYWLVFYMCKNNGDWGDNDNSFPQLWYYYGVLVLSLLYGWCDLVMPSTTRNFIIMVERTLWQKNRWWQMAGYSVMFSAVFMERKSNACCFEWKELHLLNWSSHFEGFIWIDLGKYLILYYKLARVIE